ncbi:MAG TPA: 30S ribosomal protein S3 [Chloroflexi bacterium]|nr:30S ribosomal protein S3 [Chloroflexota bacterium]
MGRKVHPIGFRLKVIKDWNARWYADGRRYGELLHEDFAIRDTIYKMHRNAGISRIEIERYPNQVLITLHTARPGIVIGRRGAAVKELRQKLEELTGGKKIKIEVEEIPSPDLDAKLVAENIASQLERRISHSRAMNRAVSQAMRQGAQGIKVMCSGRLSGAEMARREWKQEGRVPLQTLRADIDYGTAEALTTFGRIGVKVWIYKGDVLPGEEQERADVYVSQ